MNQRILFLDFDGVLNSDDFLRGVTTSMRCDNALDPTCVARANRLVKEAGAEVVISSNWRTHFALHELRFGLSQLGFTGRIIGITPIMHCHRGAEIQVWMTAHECAPDRMVILDDNVDMLHLAPRLVQTSAAVGLTDADCERAIRLFEGRA